MSNPRARKLADQIKVIVAQMLERRIKDPRLGFVTITDVRLTGDSREASIFYTVLGADADLASSAAALESAKGLLRSTIGKQLGLRFAPALEFVLDAVPENARHIEELLAQTRTADEELAARAAGAEYAGGADPYKHADSDDDFDDELQAGDQNEPDERP
ncbi:30S ribosome-binding factor RbfA [Granulicoccus sp. GXG6511]|uniref:30S ribosome-binding factor RbfA n=1 Tax=Granulicoccus sp. GXG6511 TaxID=3381351 RepID=UPI003D7CF58D